MASDYLPGLDASPAAHTTKVHIASNEVLSGEHVVLRSEAQPGSGEAEALKMIASLLK